jgi:hypothetical protein
MDNTSKKRKHMSNDKTLDTKYKPTLTEITDAIKCMEKNMVLLESQPQVTTPVTPPNNEKLYSYFNDQENCKTPEELKKIVQSIPKKCSNDFEACGELIEDILWALWTDYNFSCIQRMLARVGYTQKHIRLWRHKKELPEAMIKKMGYLNDQFDLAILSGHSKEFAINSTASETQKSLLENGALNTKSQYDFISLIPKLNLKSETQARFEILCEMGYMAFVRFLLGHFILALKPYETQEKTKKKMEILAKLLSETNSFAKENMKSLKSIALRNAFLRSMLTQILVLVKTQDIYFDVSGDIMSEVSIPRYYK